MNSNKQHFTGNGNKQHLPETHIKLIPTIDGKFQAMTEPPSARRTSDGSFLTNRSSGRLFTDSKVR